MTLLARVEDSFQLGGGCVIVFKFLAEDGKLRKKDQIQLRTPDGEVTETYVAGIVIVKHRPLVPVDKSKMSINLPRNITKQDVPPGTEIWLLSSTSEQS
jgi:hypothetical protein